MSQKKIIIIPVPAVGHSNPIIKTANELIKQYNAKVIIYAIDTFKSQIENIGAEYRKFDDINYEELMREMNFNNDSVNLIETLLRKNYELADKHAMRLAIEIDKEQPDLVLHDHFSFYAKLALRIINENFKRKDQLLKSPMANTFIPASPAPPSAVYWTTFTNDPKIYPNELEQSINLNLSFFQKVSLIWVLIKITGLARNISKKFKLPFKNPFDDLLVKNPNDTNIIFTFPELHPRSHLFDRNTNFVGACVVDNVHINGEVSYDNSEINEILKSYRVLNLHTGRNLQTRQLVYVSLGTAFNENERLFLIIINAFKKINKLSASSSYSKILKITSNDLKVLMSVGPTIFKKFQNLIENKLLELPENIILAPAVPQLEILKRASLFITHSGMNSTSESIHYAVPMICIPLNADQPLNAHRVATELGLGVILYFNKMTESDVCDAVNKIFNDLSFYDRCRIYSNLSREYIGHQNAANLIMNKI